MSQQYFIGIDLGTCFSSLAYCNDEGEIDTLKLPDGSYQLASAVYFGKDQSVVVGTEALNYSVVQAARVARAFKTHMGESGYHFACDGRTYRPEQLSAMVLKRLLDVASSQLGPIDNAVISVPHTFTEAQRYATRDAGYIAGLTNVELIDEPVAAALSYGQQLIEQGSFVDVMGGVAFEETILVFDLGGGTLDITVLRLSKDKEFQVLAVGGDSKLGGENWDDVMMSLIIPLYRLMTHTEPEGNLELLQELRLKAVEAKKTLTSRPKALIPIIHRGREQQLEVKLGDFERYSMELKDRCEKALKRVMTERDLDWRHIDHVLIVGGASRMPMIRKMLKLASKREQLDTSLAPDVAIARGAALHASHLAGAGGRTPRVTESVNLHTLGLLVGERDTRKRVNDVVLRANTPNEVETRTYCFFPGMTRLDLVVLLGDSTNPDACTILGKGGIPSLPPGLTPADKIDVTFRYKTNGMLQVTAQVRRVKGPPIPIKFELTVDGTMSTGDVQDAAEDLRGLELS